MKQHEVITVYRNGTEVPTNPLECPVLHRGYTSMVVTCVDKREMDKVFKGVREMVCQKNSSR